MESTDKAAPEFSGAMLAMVNMPKS